MLADRLHGAALHLMRGIRQADRELGVGPARLSALSVLLSGPKTLTELAEVEQVSGATISRIAAGLIRTGLATRVPNPEDGRSARLEMTAAGRRLISRGRRARVQRLESALRRLNRKDREALGNAIDALERAAWEVLKPPRRRT
jgi:DNA-binding MarR family transcriptional regulator